MNGRTITKKQMEALAIAVLGDVRRHLGSLVVVVENRRAGVRVLAGPRRLVVLQMTRAELLNRARYMGIE